MNAPITNFEPQLSTCWTRARLYCSEKASTLSWLCFKTHIYCIFTNKLIQIIGQNSAKWYLNKHTYRGGTHRNIYINMPMTAPMDIAVNRWEFRSMIIVWSLFLSVDYGSIVTNIDAVLRLTNLRIVRNRSKHQDQIRNTIETNKFSSENTSYQSKYIIQRMRERPDRRWELVSFADATFSAAVADTYLKSSILDDDMFTMEPYGHVTELKYCSVSVIKRFFPYIFVFFFLCFTCKAELLLKILFVFKRTATVIHAYFLAFPAAFNAY